jgi:hypothetical protein
MSPPSPLWSHLKAALRRCNAHKRRVLPVDSDGALPLACHIPT